MGDELLHYREAAVCEPISPLYLLGLEDLGQDLDLVDEVVEEVVDRLGHGQPTAWSFRGVLAITADRHPGFGHLCVNQPHLLYRSEHLEDSRVEEDLDQR